MLSIHHPVRLIYHVANLVSIVMVRRLWNRGPISLNLRPGEYIDVGIGHVCELVDRYAIVYYIWLLLSDSHTQLMNW